MLHPRSPVVEADQHLLTPYKVLLGAHHFDSGGGYQPRRLYQTVGLEARDGCAVVLRSRIFGHGAEGTRLEPILASAVAKATLHYAQDTPYLKDSRWELDPEPSIGRGNLSEVVFNTLHSPTESGSLPEPRSTRTERTRTLRPPPAPAPTKLVPLHRVKG